MSGPTTRVLLSTSNRVRKLKVDDNNQFIGLYCFTVSKLFFLCVDF